MQIAGYISTPLQAQTVNGIAFHQFRLAVVSRRGEKRQTAWFTVRAQLTELDVDLLEKGLRVEVSGILRLHPYVNRVGQAAVEAIIDTRQVVPAPVSSNAFEPPEPVKLAMATMSGTGNAGSAPASPPAPARAPLLPTSAVKVRSTAAARPEVPDTSVLLRSSVPVPASKTLASAGDIEDDLPF